MNGLSWRLFLTGILSLIGAIFTQFAPPAMSQANVQGQWKTLPYTMPINPVHVALLYTGKVVVVSGSGNLPTNKNLQAALWDPQAGTITTQPVTWDMFCNGMVVLPDGRPFVLGGTLQYDPFLGQLRTSAYDPASNTFAELEMMAHGRWYPTGTVLGDGRVMVFGGFLETGHTNTFVELYTVGSGWGPAIAAPWTPPLYPRLHLLPSGKVFYSGSTTTSRIFDPSNSSWTAGIAQTNFSGTRTYGSSVLLPLTPANSYTPKVMILGGSNPSTATTEIIDLSAASPQWVFGPNMSQPRVQMNATILPTGKILALGGSLNDEDTTTASLNVDLYDPNTNTFSSAGTEGFARLYHSVSLLMPDATVWVAGSNPSRGNYEPHMEIYSPAYLFNPDGSLATRPSITSVSSPTIGYGSAFQVQTPDAASVSTVVLMRNGACTHSFNMDQRYVGLTFTSGAGVLNVTGPPNGNIAPPGYYMLFILNSAGVPSVAQMVQISVAPNGHPPTGTITSPASNVTIQPGQSVTFAGTGNDSDGTIASFSWAFPGGNPSSSNVANPGSVTYSAPGTYVATLTVTDNAGLTDPNPPTRTITVPDFSVTVSPGSRSIAPGSTTTYTATINPSGGFTSNVALSVSGLPPGATASFSPASVSGSGSSTLTVSTTGSTPPGDYSLTLMGTTSTLTHSTVTSLVILQPGGTTPINFGSGFTATGMQFNGHTKLSGTRLQLTDVTAGNEVASAFWTTPVNVQSFDNNFTFQLTNPVADGFTFTVQSVGPTAIGQSGSSLGYGGIPTSVAVKFDLHSSNGDDGQNSTGLYINGTAPTTPSNALGGGINLLSGDTFHVQMTYDGTTLTMTITDTVNPNATFTISWPINIPNTIGSTTAFVGFTGATGGQMAIQEILDWSYTPTTTTPAPDFLIAVSPSSQTTSQGSSTTYTAMVTPSNGFTGNVSLNVSGLPVGASAVFNPATIAGSGSSTMTVSPTSTSATGTYPLTVTATSGALTHTAATSLTITPIGTSPAINFNSGFSAAGMQFNGHTKLNGTRLQLTDSAAGNEVASAFWTTPVSVAGFTSDFAFQLTNPNADGFTFTIQGVGATAIGLGGANLGYGGSPGIGSSVAVKFDLHNNAGEGNNSTGLYTNGASPTVPAITLGGGVNLHSGDVFQTHFAYDGTTLTMTITDTAIPDETFTTSWLVNIPGTAGASTAFVGFTAGTGGSTATQEILNWTYTPNSTTSNPDYSVAVTPGSQSIAQGGSTTYSATITPSNGFSGSVSFSVSGLPTGASGSFAPTSVTGSGTSTLTVTTTGTTATGTYPLTITATSGALTHTASTSLVITAAAQPDFSVAMTPSSQSIAQGGSTTYSATITPSNGFSGSVSFSVSGLPTGASGSFAPTSVTGAGTSTLTVTTTGTTATGTYPLTITATSGALTHTASTSLVITAAAQPDFSVAVTPSSQSIAQGGSTTYSATITPSNGFSGSVSFSVSGLPTGASGSFAPTSVTGAGTSTLTVTTTGTTATGTYPLTITATSGALTHTASTSLVITAAAQPDFSVAMTPSSQSIAQGGSTTYSATITPSNGFSGSVSFSVSGLPTGASGSFAPTSVTGAGTSTLTVTTTGTTATGTYPLTITATSGALTHTASTSLVITAAAQPDFSVAMTPSSQSIAQGGSTTYSATITPSNGFSGSVSFSVSGLPTGASGSFAPTSVTGAGTSTLTVTTTGTTATGTYPLTITATSGALTHTASTSLVITAAAQPDFSVAMTPSSQSIAQGGSTTYSATITPSNGFSGSVSFSVSGLPTGASGSFAPTSVTGSGTSTLTVTTTGTTATGTYPLTVTATSGTLTHTAATSLTITPIGTSPAINFNSGFSAAGMQFNGHTKLNGTRLQLTDSAAGNEVASAFWTTPVSVAGFTSDFAFQLTNPNADGFTFTIQGVGATAIGLGGGNLGYGGSPGIGSSVAVKFDLHNNAGEGNNSTGLYTNGASPTVPAITLGGGVNLHSGDIFQTHFAYDGTTLTMTITDTTVPADTFTISFPINIPATVGASTAFVGFTAGTGGSTATQEILNWTYTPNSTTSNPDYSVAVTPSSQSIAQGGSTTYSATITPSNGFSGSVSFSVSGLPTGASGSFAPTSVTGSGSSTLTVMATTGTGTYPLTVTATSGTLTHTASTLLVITQSSGTPTINFGSGFSAAGMQFNGHTKLNGTRLQLTDSATSNEVASAFWTTAVSVTTFTTDFTFQLTNPNADGFTFTIQGVGATAIGLGGGNLGYGGSPGIGSSVAVKFDLHDNAGEGNNSTGLYTNGASPTVPAITLGGGVNLHSGDIFQTHFAYDGTTLTMTITDTTVPADTLTISFPINIPAAVGSSNAFVGFTAGTGGGTATQEIIGWTYNTP